MRVQVEVGGGAGRRSVARKPQVWMDAWMDMGIHGWAGVAAKLRYGCSILKGAM